jgi:hypothetical protein
MNDNWFEYDNDDSWDDSGSDDDMLDALYFLQQIESLRNEVNRQVENFSKSRPIFSDAQVLSFEDLEIGKHYERHCAKSLPYIAQIASEPYISEGGYWVVDIYSVAYDFIYSESLADCGIIPYENERWNSSNYILRIE